LYPPSGGYVKARSTRGAARKRENAGSDRPLGADISLARSGANTYNSADPREVPLLSPRCSGILTLQTRMPPPKPALQLDELTAIQRRFQRVFLFMNLLTLALVVLVGVRLTGPSPPKIADNLGICLLAFSSACLCAGQFYCLRRTSKESRTRIERLAFLDALTGAHNHRYLDMALRAELKRAKRYAHSLCLAYIDLDSFKPVNDDFGHEIGNHVLADIGRILLVTVRESDTLGRVGGDEFIIILPETDLSGAHIFSERLRTEVEELFADDIVIPRDKRVSFSSGIATFPADAATKDELISHADMALYQAKRSGKNRTCLYSSSMSEK